MTQFFEQAVKLEPPKIIIEKYPNCPKLYTLTALCGVLQKATGQNPFFLSCRTAGKLLKVTPMTISRYFLILTAEKFLEVVEKGGAESQKATRFRYTAVN
jgi:hypothetical protein